MKIAFTGGKGGTGKSTIAVNVANEIGKSKKVLLVDMDADCPNDYIFLGVELKNRKDVELFVPKMNDNCDLCGKCVEECPENALIILNDKVKVLRDMCIGCRICKMVCPRNGIDDDKKTVGHVYFSNAGKVDLLTAEIVEGERENVHAINYAKKIMPNGYDFYIFDTAAGARSHIVSVLSDADYVFAVTEPTLFGEHDLKSILEISKEIGKKVYVIINKSDVGNVAGIEKLCAGYGAEIISRIKFDRKLVEYYMSNKILDESVPSYKEIKRISNFIGGLK